MMSLPKKHSASFIAFSEKEFINLTPLLKEIEEWKRERSHYLPFEMWFILLNI